MIKKLVGKNTIKTKISALNIVTMLIVIIIFLAIVFVQKSSIDRKIDKQLNILMENDIGNISKGIYNQLETLNEILLEDVKNNLKVTRKVINSIGNVSNHVSETVEWDAINQFTKSNAKIKLAKFLVGNQWLGQNRSMDTPSLVVDEVKTMVGGTVTIFQRMNTEGDMLRVCTNVKKLDGTRAIGTFIPAKGTEGKPNAVVSTVLSGRTFHGRAFVVNAWYLTAYEPIYNDKKEVIGVLYYGIQQEKSKALREAILKTTVGKSGYIYVLSAKENTKGNYVISKGGARDGENIYNAKDSSGRFFIRSIIDKAIKLKPGQVAFEEYPWLNPGESRPRIKKAAITYFEPWDWVIGAGTYIDDFTEAKTQVSDSVFGIVYWSVITAVILLTLGFMTSLFFSSKLAAPLKRLVTVIKDIAEGEGDLTKRLEVMESNDEIHDLAHWFNIFLDKLQVMILNIKQSSVDISSVTEEISQGSLNLAERTSEQGASLTETSTTLEEFTTSVNQNTEHSEEADNILENLNMELKKKSELVGNVTGTMSEIYDSSKRIDNIVNVINDISFQTNLLALNAAVEAARAGEAGRGFAVVATEVRNLAQKTAESSKTIQNIVTQNVDSTQKGMELVQQTSEFFNRVSLVMDDVVKKITGIATSSKQQSIGIEQINQAIMHLDEVTNQNMAMVEELSAAGVSTKANAKDLHQLVERFKLK